MDIRLINLGQQFRSQGVFLDVTLKYKNETPIKAHALFLAKYSTWFREELKKVYASAGSNGVEIELPWNDSKAVETVIDAFYNGSILLTPKNAPSILKAAEFYKFSIIPAIAKAYIIEIVKSYEDDKEDIRAEYCRLFVKYQLAEYYDLLVDYAARKYKELKIGEDQNETIDEVYKMCADGRFIAKIFQHQDYEVTKSKDPGAQLLIYDIKRLYNDDDDLICEQFDYFFKNFRTDMSLEEKEALSDVKIIDWNNNEKYKLIIKHTCSWLDPKISRNLYGRVLANRRQVIKHFEAELKQIKEEKVNRWYSASWLSQITAAIDSETTPEINVVEFMTTLGHAVDYVDPELYGFINPGAPNSENHKENILAAREPSNAFYNDRRCFTAIQNVGNGKYVQYKFNVDFGKTAIFHAKKILVDMKDLYRHTDITDNNSRNLDEKRLKPHRLPPKVYVEYQPAGKQDCFEPSGLGVDWAKFDHVLNKFAVMVDEKRISLFLRYVDIKGVFLPTITLPNK